MIAYDCLVMKDKKPLGFKSLFYVLFPWFIRLVLGMVSDNQVHFGSGPWSEKQLECVLMLSCSFFKIK